MSQHQRNEAITALLKEVSPNVSFESESDFQVYFERLLPSPKPYLEGLKRRVSGHPVRYIRQEGGRHIKENLPLEGDTHIDLLIESRELLVPVEAKFTADISCGTTYDAERNQIARNIDVAIGEAEKSTPHKKIIFLLCVPERFAKAKSRLYIYKMEEYGKDPGVLQGELGHRSSEELKLVVGMGLITWEKTLEIIYGSSVENNLVGDWELDVLREFYGERGIGFSPF